MQKASVFFLFFFFLFNFLVIDLVHSDANFVFNGFSQANLSLEGDSFVKSNGMLVLTNDSSKLLGHAFYPFPLQFRNHRLFDNIKSASSAVVSSFSTNFVFSIVPKYPELGGHGLAFVLFSSKDPENCLPNQYLGLPNFTIITEVPIRMLAVEFDIVQNFEFQDMNDNHVGIDISSLISNISEPAAYFSSNSRNGENGNKNISIILKNGDPVQAWVDYDSQAKVMNVSISPIGVSKPCQPLISFSTELSPVLDEFMYIGFSASTGLLTAAHNIHGWSFRIGGKAQDLNPKDLPTLNSNEVVHQKGFKIGITLARITLVILVISGAIHVLCRIRNEDEILEDWEVEYGTRRFKYSELYNATRGFGDRNLIGSGGFGRVYRGVIPSTGLEVAVKRIAHDSRQGMKEFVAEITSMGRLRHRNLVQLHGWCRKLNELLLVYDYIPNGSLDKLLFENGMPNKKLTWNQRYKIIIDVAQALSYLHEECDQRVIHRDVKPSNVLIDADLSAKLGDFGLARIYEHGLRPETTHIVGTLGYLAPELTRTGKATTSTDVYGYGILLLEVACGRKPIEPQKNAEELLLVDWVREQQSKGEIVRAVDPTLDGYDEEEVGLVLKLGLLCSHPHPEYRPTMRRVVQFLMRDASLPA
ncbi:L-type lectin-domain containing receptor kinase SIT2-like [Ziziphus jujuba]|uniref:non-specific serine/threonine protein kinase n=1 Tax=Ziziphus jujuba TaxID=326968 RepID=A0A6P6GGT1_ZIZJJ|nr:L-type lectin-domain containing receptor kinase SIT2-like [Ziziphus jujuba]